MVSLGFEPGATGWNGVGKSIEQCQPARHFYAMDLNILKDLSYVYMGILIGTFTSLYNYLSISSFKHHLQFHLFKPVLSQLLYSNSR